MILYKLTDVEKYISIRELVVDPAENRSQKEPSVQLLLLPSRTEPSTLLRMLVAGFCALWCRGEIVCHRAVIPYTTKLYSKLLVCNHRAESVSATFLGFPPPKLLSDAHLRQTHNCLSAGLIPSHPVILFTDLENLVVSRGGGAKIYASPSSGWEVRPSYTGSPNLRRDSPDL